MQASATPSTPLDIAPERWVQAVQAAWRTSGHRVTEPRIRVLRCIASYATPFSAEQLYADLQQHGTVPGRATVYRTLEQLAGTGWLARIHAEHTESGYSPSWPGHVHHIVCSSCGRVVPFEGCALGHLLQTLKQQTGFAIEGHLLQVYGRCAACQGQSHEPAAPPAQTSRA